MYFDLLLVLILFMVLTSYLGLSLVDEAQGVQVHYGSYAIHYGA